MPEQDTSAPVTHLRLESLRRAHPSWSVEMRWTSANSGPGRCGFVASRNAVLLSAWDLDTLGHQIEAEEASELPGGGDGTD